MKKRIISAVSAMACAIMLFAATPATVAAAEKPEFSHATSSIVGATSVEKGSVNVYDLQGVLHYVDGSTLDYGISLLFPEEVQWSLMSSVAGGTSLSVDNGYAVLTVSSDETAGGIVLQGYEAMFENTAEISVYVNGNTVDTTPTETSPRPAVNAPSTYSAAPSDADPFWLGVHQSVTKGAKTVTVNADGFTFVPFYVLDALRGKNTTLTITCGLDNYVLNGKSIKNLREGASYSFGNLADILNVKADSNSRGGITYSTQK